MKIAKKILISSLAIIPLTTLAFTPSVVRPKKVETCGNNYTQGIWEFPADNSYWVNIAKKLLKEFDMYISPNKTPYLALKIEEIRDEINKKIQKQQEEIEKIEKHKGDCDYAIYTDDLKLHKFYIDCLNSKLKTLEKIENELITRIMKYEYKTSMKKYYSSEALKTIISKIQKVADEIKNITSSCLEKIDKKSANKEYQKEFDNLIEKQKELLIDLNEQRKILEKHFKLQ